MYDVSAIKRRYFSVKLHVTDEDGQDHTTTVEVKPPKLKVMEDLMESVNGVGNADSEKDVIKALRESVEKLLDSNKAGFKIPREYIEAMDFDELNGLLDAFFTWMADTKKN
ncbi:MAG: hypothetical protein E7572_05535 [Ruminococcaceae bacterium]|nr:hypothetical protein [Oscillospiraceae bacterium]